MAIHTQSHFLFSQQKKRVLGLLLILPSYGFSSHGVARDLSSMINYDYVQAGLYSGTYHAKNHSSNNVSTLDFNLSYQWLPNIVLLGDYSARFIHPKNTTIRVDSLMPGVAYRVDISQQWDLLVGYHAGITKWNEEYKYSNTKMLSDTQFIQGASAQINYAFSPNWLAHAVMQFNRSDLFDEDSYKLALDYFITPHFSMGGVYAFRSTPNVNTNEGGLRLRLEY